MSRPWTNTRILGACGLAAAVFGTAGGWVGAGWPRIGLALLGVANGTMLVANLVLLFRRER